MSCRPNGTIPNAYPLQFRMIWQTDKFNSEFNKFVCPLLSPSCSCTKTDRQHNLSVLRWTQLHRSYWDSSVVEVTAHSTHNLTRESICFQQGQVKRWAVNLLWSIIGRPSSTFWLPTTTTIGNRKSRWWRYDDHEVHRPRLGYQLDQLCLLVWIWEMYLTRPAVDVACILYSATVLMQCKM